MAGSRLIVSTMKDEAPYLLEWVAYHRVIGFTDFLVYTNDCSDGTDLMLERLELLGVATHERNDVLRRGAHKSALKYALAHEKLQQADWVFVADADEFLSVKHGKRRLDDLLSANPDADVIPVTWRMFAAAQQVDLDDRLLIEQLTQCQPYDGTPTEKGRFVKSLFRPSDRIERLGLHVPVFSEEAQSKTVWGGPKRAEGANPERPKGDYGYDIAQVNHYALRSLNAFIFKKFRGRANHMDQDLGLPYWTRWNAKGDVDRAMLDLADAVKQEKDRLCEDPILKHLDLAARDWHKSKLQELLSDPVYAGLRDEIVALEGISQQVSEKPRRHANRMRLLEHMPLGGRCAEIGVWNGGFSQNILRITKPAELILIDPWDLVIDTTDTTKTHAKHSDAEAMRGMYDHVSGLFEDDTHVTVKRGFSADILSEYPDDYFDWVYIDGNHLYDFVYRDVDLSFAKVKPGGIIAGDDFFWKRDGRMHVREAVLDAMRAHGLHDRPKRFGQQFMITVPGAP